MGAKKPASRGEATTLSMTGFGKASFDAGSVAIEVEIKAVNNRFVDCIFKLPKPYTQFELDIRNLVTSKLNRGRIEIFVSRTAISSGDAAVSFRRELYEQCYEIARGVCERTGKLSDDNHCRVALSLLGRKEILEFGEEGEVEESEKESLLGTVGRALDDLCRMRAAEGSKIGEDIAARLESLRALRAKIAAIVGNAPQDIKARLLSRLAKLAPEVQLEPARLAAEVALLSDRVDVTEELVRLESHFKQFQEALQNPPNGRKLDFLIQELGREFNTISSKAQDAAVQALVVDAKVEMEKLREQVQNIE